MFIWLQQIVDLLLALNIGMCADCNVPIHVTEPANGNIVGPRLSKTDIQVQEPLCAPKLCKLSHCELVWKVAHIILLQNTLHQKATSECLDATNGCNGYSATVVTCPTVFGLTSRYFTCCSADVLLKNRGLSNIMGVVGHAMT